MSNQLDFERFKQDFHRLGLHRLLDPIEEIDIERLENVVPVTFFQRGLDHDIICAAPPMRYSILKNLT